MMDADPASQQPRQGCSEAPSEAEVSQRRGQLRLARLGAQVHAQQ